MFMFYGKRKRGQGLQIDEMALRCTTEFLYRFLARLLPRSSFEASEFQLCLSRCLLAWHQACNHHVNKIIYLTQKRVHQKAMTITSSLQNAIRVQCCIIGCANEAKHKVGIPFCPRMREYKTPRGSDRLYSNSILII